MELNWKERSLSIVEKVTFFVFSAKKKIELKIEIDHFFPKWLSNRIWVLPSIDSFHVTFLTSKHHGDASRLTFLNSLKHWLLKSIKSLGFV